MTSEHFRNLHLRVYYEDTDFSGRVYHASYLRFMERARTEWLRDLGFSHSQLAAERGLAFAVRALDVKFLAPALIDDLLRVETRVAKLGAASVEFVQDIFCGRRHLTSARIGVVMLSGGRVARIPADLRQTIGGTR
jgi:acyl-CoA thioester hydrolase